MPRPSSSAGSRAPRKSRGAPRPCVVITESVPPIGLRLLTPKDLHDNSKFGIALSHEQLGHYRWVACSPYGRVLEFVGAGEPIGIAAAQIYGLTAWVSGFHLRGDAGMRLRPIMVRQAIEWLWSEGVACIMAPAPIADEDLWVAQGGRVLSQLTRYSEGRFTEASDEHVVPFDPTHTLGLLHLDRQATGSERSALLLEHTFLAQVYAQAGRLRGYLLPLTGDGWIVADSIHVGQELLRWLLPLRNEVVLPSFQTAASDQLTTDGYRAERLGTLIQLGEHRPLRLDLVYAFGARGLWEDKL